MASVYVEQMRAVQPSGPYALVGYSFGGLVAFEIAQQLIAAGEKIELLCLLDTYVDERYLPLPAWVRFQSEVMADRVRTVRELSARERLGYVKERLSGAADRIRMRLGKMALQARARHAGSAAGAAAGPRVDARRDDDVSAAPLSRRPDRLRAGVRQGRRAGRSFAGMAAGRAAGTDGEKRRRRAYRSRRRAEPRDGRGYARAPADRRLTSTAGAAE